MQGNVIEDQMYNNDANQAYQKDKSDNHNTNEAYQDDKTRSDMSNENTGVTDDPQYEANQANEGNNNQDHPLDEEYTTEIDSATEEEGDRVTIEDKNIKIEMNTSQMAIEQQAMEQQEEDTSPEMPRRTHRYNLRKRLTINTSMTQTHGNTNTGVASCDTMTIHPKMHAHIMLTKMNVKQGLVKYGEKGSQAVLKELRQLHNTGALLPVKKEDMSYDDKRKVLRYLMFLKEKRDGTIKAQGCVDGRLQRFYTTKEESSSPNVSLEAMMLTCTIYAKENRYVIVTDIPSAFLHADMEGTVHLILEGEVAELILNLEPTTYAGYTWKNHKGKTMIYVQLKKALYGTLQAALIFWKLLSNTLQEWGFMINDYDRCVANKIINGKQCTIIWHVDNLKI